MGVVDGSNTHCISWWSSDDTLWVEWHSQGYDCTHSWHGLVSVSMDLTQSFLPSKCLVELFFSAISYIWACPGRENPRVFYVGFCCQEELMGWFMSGVSMVAHIVELATILCMWLETRGASEFAVTGTKKQRCRGRVAQVKGEVQLVKILQALWVVC
jgi:hypothetical protein